MTQAYCERYGRYYVMLLDIICVLLYICTFV